MNMSYIFNAKEAYQRIEKTWKEWASDTNAKNMVIGISGGKDSSVVAALAVKIFGKDRVIGVEMPNTRQDPISQEVLKCLDIKSINLSIFDLVDNCAWQMELNGLSLTDDSIINLPARLRMTLLYYVAQSIEGRVINTSNLSENMIGYSTLFGDLSGSFAPIAQLTATEVIQLGLWLGLPSEIVCKVPEDGLCGMSDEEKLGFTYSELDKYIREDLGSDEFKNKINEMYYKNKFKMDIVRIPDVFHFLPNHITGILS